LLRLAGRLNQQQAAGLLQGEGACFGPSSSGPSVPGMAANRGRGRHASQAAEDEERKKKEAEDAAAEARKKEEEKQKQEAEEAERKKEEEKQKQEAKKAEKEKKKVEREEAKRMQAQDPRVETQSLMDNILKQASEARRLSFVCKAWKKYNDTTSALDKLAEKHGRHYTRLEEHKAGKLSASEYLDLKRDIKLNSDDLDDELNLAKAVIAKKKAKDNPRMPKRIRRAKRRRRILHGRAFHVVVVVVANYSMAESVVVLVAVAVAVVVVVVVVVQF